MLRPIISENDPPFFAPWVTSAHQFWKKSEALSLTFVMLNIFYILHCFPIIILFTCSILGMSMYLQEERKTVWIQISWLHQKPADLDLNFSKKDKSGFSWKRDFYENLMTSKAVMEWQCIYPHKTAVRSSLIWIFTAWLVVSVRIYHLKQYYCIKTHATHY